MYQVQDLLKHTGDLWWQSSGAQLSTQKSLHPSPGRRNMCCGGLLRSKFRHAQQPGRYTARDPKMLKVNTSLKCKKFSVSIDFHLRFPNVLQRMIQLTAYGNFSHFWRFGLDFKRPTVTCKALHQLWIQCSGTEYIRTKMIHPTKQFGHICSLLMLEDLWRACWKSGSGSGMYTPETQNFSLATTMADAHAADTLKHTRLSETISKNINVLTKMQTAR